MPSLSEIFPVDEEVGCSYGKNKALSYWCMFKKCLRKRIGMQNVLLDSFMCLLLMMSSIIRCVFITVITSNDKIFGFRPKWNWFKNVLILSCDSLTVFLVCFPEMCQTDVFSFGLILYSDFPGEVSGRSAVERMSPLLWKTRTKRRRPSNSGEIYSEQGTTEADIDSDSGYCSPKHNQAPGATQRTENTTASTVSLLFTLSS